MRMLLSAEFPPEPFNTLVRKGTIDETIKKVMEAIKPEAAYFTEQDGKRGVMMVVDLKDPSSVPSMAEPLFLSFNAECRFRIAMTPEDLAKAGLEAIAKKWA